MAWRLVAAWLVAMTAVPAQHGELAPELLTLARIKTSVAATLSRQPNYTCVQQIERSHRRLPKRKFELRDLLRIEVALVEGKEMFAWPGAGKFEQSDLTEMVTAGAIGTGDFALHARAVFEGPAPRFKYAGETELRSHQTNRYDFVVSVLNSGYKIKSAGREAIVGYHGSFWTDVDTNQLVRLEVSADDIPPELGIAEAQDVMDYGPVRIGASEFVLPVGSDLTMTDLAGNQSRNRTQFRACRQYSGESVLTFDGAPESENESATPLVVEAKRAKESIDIPLDLTFDIRLGTEIDSESSAVGDRMTATLDQKLTVRRRVLFPKGATLTGRITRLERQGELTTIDVQFSEIESEDGRSTFLAKVEETLLPMPSYTRSTSGSLNNRNSAEGGIHVRSNRIRLRPGFRLRVRTIATAQHSGQ